VKITSKISIEAEISLNDREAAILAHITSFQFLHWFESNCSRQFSKEELTDTLRSMAVKCETIVKAKHAADTAAFKTCN
jgi:hypothetical protein